MDTKSKQKPISYKKLNHFSNFILESNKLEQEQNLPKQPYTDEQFAQNLAKWIEESEKHQYSTDTNTKLIFEKANGESDGYVIDFCNKNNIFKQNIIECIFTLITKNVLPFIIYYIF